MAANFPDNVAIRTVNDTLIVMLEASRWQLMQAVDGFQGVHWMHVPADGVACAAWIMGHVVLVDRHVLDELEARSLPELPEGWEALHASRPEEPTLLEYEPARRLLDQFLAHRKALIAAVATLPAALFDRDIDPPPAERYKPLRGDSANPLFDYRTTGEMIANMALYTCQLSGELCIIRQSLGMKIHDEWLF